MASSTPQLRRLSIFATMFGNLTYIVSQRGRIKKAGNVGDVQTAKAKAVEAAREVAGLGLKTDKHSPELCVQVVRSKHVARG